MNEKLFIQMCEIIVSLAALGGITAIIMATWYDLRVVAHKKILQALERKLHKSRQPAITILVYAHNNADTIFRCLQSIGRSRYVNYRILIVDNGSTDDTKQIVAKYKHIHVKIPLRLLHRKIAIDRASALCLASKQAKTSEFIFILEATDRIAGNVLKRGVAHFVANTSLDFIHLQPSLSYNRNIAALPGIFISLSRNLLQKATSGWVIGHPDISANGLLIRSEAFSAPSMARKPRSAYVSNLTYVASSVVSSSEQRRFPVPLLRSLVALIVSLLVIVMVTYFFLTAALLHSSAFLTVTWAMVAIWLLAIVWSDEMIPLSTKLEISSTIPFMYFILYVQVIVYTLRELPRLILRVPRPTLPLAAIRDAVRIELYSTRY